jgi:hypothetical protein
MRRALGSFGDSLSRKGQKVHIDFQLKSVLQRYELDKRSIFSFIQVERDVNLSRRVVADLYYNRRVSITLNQLERLCRWLHGKGVPAHELPGALFRFYPSGLVNVLTAAGRVRIYLGDYFQRHGSHLPADGESWADSEVASNFIGLLSTAPPVDRAPDAAESSAASNKGLMYEYALVPFQDPPGKCAPKRGRPAPESAKNVRRIFRAMREYQSPVTNILIGSQRANPLVELFVADLFGCEPFADARGRLPFYLYGQRSPSWLVPSCFGGTDLPADCPDGGPHGIYYRVNGQRWELCPSIPNEADAGVVIVRRVPGRDQTELVVFGFSSVATRAMGEFFRRDPDQFWGSLQRLKGGVEARVYVCRIPMRVAAVDARPQPVLKEVKVHRLEFQDLAKARKSCRGGERLPAPGPAKRTRRPEAGLDRGRAAAILA